MLEPKKHQLTCRYPLNRSTLHSMSEPDSKSEPIELRRRAAGGDQDAIDQLVELAGERNDLDELRSLAGTGSSDAVDILVELAGERGDRAELQRLADAGSQDAADILEELDS